MCINKRKYHHDHHEHTQSRNGQSHGLVDTNMGDPTATKNRLLASHIKDPSSISRYLTKGSLASNAAIINPSKRAT
jgi:hypothetical protein